MTDARRLTRSETDRVVAGVAGGLAAHLSLDPTLVRLAFVLLAVFGGSGLLIYLVMWAVVPKESALGQPPDATLRDAVSEVRASAEKLADDVRKGWKGTGSGGAAGPTA